jgi:hypothetical protein
LKIISLTLVSVILGRSLTSINDDCLPIVIILTFVGSIFVVGRLVNQFRVFSGFILGLMFL